MLFATAGAACGKLGTRSDYNWKLAKHFQFHYPQNISFLGDAEAYYIWCIFIPTKIKETPLHPWTKMTYFQLYKHLSANSLI